MEKIYRSLPLEENEIRILTLHGNNNPEAQIQCTLRIASLKVAPRPLYKALSYTWGQGKGNAILVDARDVHGGILVNALEFVPGANLHSALQHFRDTKDDIDIWADAICINQELPSDSLEKTAQIGLMREIFLTATDTWVWLGSKGEESEKAISLIKRLSQALRSQNPSPKYTETTRSEFPKTWGSDIKNELCALENLLVRDYWYRVWIVQEIAVSKTVTVFCSGDSVSWDELFDAAYYVDGGVGVKEAISEQRVVLSGNTRDKSRRVGTTPAKLRDINAGIQRIISIQSVRNDIQKTDAEELELEPPDSLLFLLSNHRSTDSTFAVDKYIALAGLINDRRPPSTTNAKDVYVWAALSVANQQKSYVRPGLALDFLDCAGLPVTGTFTKKKKAAIREDSCLPEEIFPDLPSWVPDWSYHQPRASPLLHWQFSGKDDESKVYFNATENIATKYDPFIVHPVFMTSLIMSPFVEKTQVHPAASGRSVGEKDLPQDSLSAYGIQFDEVIGVGFSEWASFDTRKVQNGKDSEPSSVDSYPTAPNGAHEDLEDVVWKTCILNRTARGQRPPLEWGELFYAHIKSQEWYENNKKFNICGRTLENITINALNQKENLPHDATPLGYQTPKSVKQSPMVVKNSESLDLLTMAFKIATGRRRLASTKRGCLCMAPYNTQLGDKIVILFDCHAPVVLREDRDKRHHIFIGTCYVHGIMNGEVARMNGFVSQWFDIQ